MGQRKIVSLKHALAARLLGRHEDIDVEPLGVGQGVQQWTLEAGAVDGQRFDIIAMRFFFAANQRLGVGTLIGPAWQHIHGRDDLAVSVHRHVHQVAGVIIAVLGSPRVGIVDATRMVFAIGVVAIVQHLAGQRQRLLQRLSPGRLGRSKLRTGAHRFRPGH